MGNIELLIWKPRCVCWNETLLFKLQWRKYFHFRGGRCRHGREIIHQYIWAQLFEEFLPAEWELWLHHLSLVLSLIKLWQLQNISYIFPTTCKWCLVDWWRKWADAFEGLFACSYFYLFFPSFLSLSKLEVDPENFRVWGWSQIYVSFRSNSTTCWVMQLVQCRKCSGSGANRNRRELTQVCAQRAQLECADTQQNEMKYPH